MQPQSQKTSVIIRQIVASAEGQGMTVGQFMAELGDRAFWLAIFIFSLLALFAGVVPGISTILAMPIVLLSVQVLVGRATVWLPKRVANKHISQKALNILVSKALPYVVRLEKVLRPRILWLSSPVAERVMTLAILAAAGILIVPIPGVHFFPCLGMVILSLGLLERDGYFILGALLITIGSVDAMFALIKAAIHEMLLGLHAIF